MTLKGRIETVLFVTAKAMQIEEIAEILNEQPEDVEMALLELIMDYSAREGALEIDDESGYILQVREDYIDIVEADINRDKYIVPFLLPIIEAEIEKESLYQEQARREIALFKEKIGYDQLVQEIEEDKKRRFY